MPAHQHNHNEHGHSHAHTADTTGKAFVIGIALNMGYVVVETTMGLLHHSMSLVADAGHNLGDVAGLILSWLAFRLARIKPSGTFTYGYKKTTILAALINAVILLVSVGLLGYESVRHIFEPRVIEGGMMAIVAGVGIVVNFGSAMLFTSHRHELNSRGAYLHLMADAAVSLAVVIAGIIIRYTGMYWIDGIVSLVILLVILVSTWSMLTSSLKLSLDAVPDHIRKEEIEHFIASIPGVEAVRHIHIWAMSTSETALTAHLVLADKLSFAEKLKLVHHVKHELQHKDIQHATIEMDAAGAHDDMCNEE